MTVKSVTTKYKARVQQRGFAMDDDDQLAFDTGIFAAAADRFLENRHYSTLLRDEGHITRELLDVWKEEAYLLGMPRDMMEPSEEELAQLPRILELNDRMAALSSSEKAWPNETDRIAWELYRATDPGRGLPPYDAAGDDLQRIWHGMLRLTMGDIATVCKDVLNRIKSQ
jgi:hypothetical protein